jgi:hypothetical protein
MCAAITPGSDGGHCCGRYSLRFLGHSLGAGVAALATLLLREGWTYSGALPSGVLPTATCLACPPVVCRQVASSCSEYITTIVFQVTLLLSGSGSLQNCSCMKQM